MASTTSAESKTGIDRKNKNGISKPIFDLTDEDQEIKDNHSGVESKKLSLIESVTEKNLDVMSQYDGNNIMTASNQCSWCAYEFASNAQELRVLWMTGKTEQFTNLYNNCVLSGSTKRKEYNKYVCGENIDDPEIIKTYTNILSIDTGKTVLNAEAVVSVDLLPEELRNVFFVRDSITEKSMHHVRERLRMDRIRGVFIVNRFGQSFTVIPLCDNTYLITDSHCRKTGNTTMEGLMNYLTFNNDSGYNLILWIWGCVSN